MKKTLLLFLSIVILNNTFAQVNHLVISQIYGSGGNTSATYKNDFIELFNPTGASVNLSGYSVQYAAATGTSWTVTNLSGSIAAGKYYLVQLASGGAVGANLPTADATGTTNMSATAGKVLLASTTTAYTTSCPTTNVIDFVGFGTNANCREGAALANNAPAQAATTADLRANNGCNDTQDNAADFSAVAVSPRNSSSSAVYCYPISLSITSVSPATPQAGIPFSITVTAKNAGGNAMSVLTNTSFSISTNGNAGLLSGTTAGTISAGSNSVTISGLVLNTTGVGVYLVATRTSGDNLSAGGSSNFNVICGAINVTNNGAGASCASPTVNLVANSSVNLNYTYLWTPGNLTGASVTASLNNQTTYTVTGTDAMHNCSSSMSITVNPAGLQYSGGSWTTRANYQGIMTSAGTGFAIGNKGYAGLGLYRGNNKKDIWEFDPITDRWIQKANYPGLGSYYIVGFNIGNKAYVGSGRGATIGYSDDFYEFDPIANTWIQRANIPGGGRQSAFGFSIGSKGYVGMGESNGTFLTDLWEFDPINNSWVQKTNNLPFVGRFGAISVSAGTKAYVGLGFSNTNGLLSDLWEYNSTNNQWVAKATFPGSPRRHANAFVIGNDIYVVGGFVGGASVNDIWKYNTQTNTWLQLPNMPTPIIEGGFAFTINNFGYLGAGDNYPNDTYTESLYRYVPNGILSCSVPNSSYCQGSSGSVSYSSTSLALENCNTFYVQLSNSSGSFSSPTNIGSLNSSAISGSISFTLPINLSPGTGYRIRVVSNLNSCTVNDNGSNISINQLPTITITGNNSVCAGSSLTLTASGGVSYLWGNNAETASINDNPSNSTTYEVLGIDANNCSGYATKTVTVNTLPTVSIAGNNSVCVGSSLTLTASGAVSYLWGNNAETASITDNPATTKTYEVLGFDANNCSGYATKTVTVNALPTVSITGNASVCLGTSTTLTASGASSYVWTDGPSNASNTVTPSSTTSYTVTGTDANGCVNTASQTVTVNALPTVSITGNNTVCSGNSTTLTASGASSYAWTGGPSTASNTVTPSTTTSYTVTGTDANGCIGAASQSVTVNALPNLSIEAEDTICDGTGIFLVASGADSYVWNDLSTNDSLFINPHSTTTYSVTGTINGCSSNVSKIIVVNQLPEVLIMAETNSICAGSSIVLTADGASTYTWDDESTEPVRSVSPTTTSTYTLFGVDDNGCLGFTAVTITVNQNPTVSITGNNTICVGGSTNLTASGALTYSWNTGATTAGIGVSPSTTTSYDVIGTDANGCIGTASKTVIVNALPTVSIAGNNSVCDGSNVTLTANGIVTYAWSNNSTGVSIDVTPSTTTTYTVTGVDANGCSGSASKTVTVNQNPTISVTGNNNICAGGSTALTATGASTYTWSNNATTGTINVTPSITSTYTVVGTASNGCAGVGSRTVVVNATPSISAIATPSTITPGQSSTLTASGATTYSWITGATTASISVSPTVTTAYSVTGTTNGCSATTSTTVTVSGTASNLTKLTTTYCGSTLPALTSDFWCVVVTSATNYEYEFTDVATNVVTTKVSATSAANMTLPTALAVYGKTYNVRVRAKVGGSFGSFGTVCQLSTASTIPATKLTTATCGITLATPSSAFWCDIVSGASNYEYEFTDVATSVVTTKLSPSSASNMSLPVALALYGKTYDVRVRAKVGAAFGSFGTVCQVITPASIPATKLTTAYCGVTLATPASAFWCDVVNAASNYEYEFTDVATSVVTTKLSASSGSNMSLPAALAVAGKTYDVRVRAKSNGSFGPFGTPCQITTPSGARLVNPFATNATEETNLTVAKEQVLLQAYPNPSNGTFTLQSNRAGKYMLMNELGEVIKTYTLSNENNNTQLIEGLQAGLYIIVSNQAEGTVSHKIIVTK